MKKLLIVPILLLAAVFLWNCEKDDICDENTPTTPMLVITFYDYNNPTVAKNVTNLGIIADGVTEPLGVYNAVSTISIPLKTTEDITNYSFILNSTDVSLSNEDRLSFNYTRENVYISRACGFKTLFTLDDTTPIVHTDGAATDGLWIRHIDVNQPNIQTENETHVNIYF